MNRDMTERIAWFATATEGSGHASAAFYAEEEAQFQIVYRILPGKAGNGNFPGAA